MKLLKLFIRPSRLTFIILLIASSRAVAVVDVDSQVRQYNDGRTYVLSPSVDASATFNNDTMTITAGSTQDLVSSASADVTTFGSKSTESRITDRRYEYSAGLSTLIPDGALSVGAIQSDENDYHSTTVTASTTREFFTKNTVVGLGFANGDDHILSSSNKSFSGFMRNQVYSLSITQILSKVSLVQLIYDFRVENGYLASPYRRAKFEDLVSGLISARDENHPRTRNRNAAAIKYNYFAEKWATSFATTYRFYQDSWGVLSQTLEERVTKEFSKQWELSLVLRYYTQSKARFYQDYYTDSTSVFYTGNNTLATYSSYLIGLRPAYTLNDRISIFAKLEVYEEKFSDATDAYLLSTKFDDKALAISAKVIGLGVSAKF